MKFIRVTTCSADLMMELAIVSKRKPFGHIKQQNVVTEKKSRSAMRCGKLAAFPLESNGDDSLSIIGRKWHAGLRRNNRTNQVYSAKSPIGSIACPLGTNMCCPLSTHNRDGHCCGIQPGFGSGSDYIWRKFWDRRSCDADRCDLRKCKKRKKPAPTFPGGPVSSLVIQGYHCSAALRRRAGRI
jgi:hypothetical protein